MTPAPPAAAELVAPPSWSAVDFISDLHLEPAQPQTLHALVHYLASTAADAVFILGDLFEVWVGDDAMDESGSFEAQCCQQLAPLARRLTIYFMHGNRDFLIGPGFTRHTGIQLLPDPTALVFAQQRWLLSHGDALCLDDVQYQEFRALVRQPQWQAQLLARPLAERRAQGRAVRSQSEARKQSGQAIYADVDAPSARAWLHAAQAQALIHGHTHLPADHPLGTDLTRHVLSDWDMQAPTARAQVLRLSQQGLQRINLT